MEGAVPGAVKGGPDLGQEVAVADGTVVWFYLPESNQYASIAASELTAAGGDLGDASPAAMDTFMMWRYRGATGLNAGADFLREEAIGFAGAKVACYVLSVAQKKGGAPYTWWVDKQRYRILREDDAGSSTVYTTIKLGEPLPDELFQFKPPPGAQKIEMRN